MNNTAILEMLRGGDRRSIGRSNEVVEFVLAEPALFEAVFSGMSAGDAVLRMRCADAVEKISARRPELLQPHKSQLIELAANSKQQEVRWHAAQMISRLALNASEHQAVIEILQSYLDDKSSIVKTFAMQALADIATGDATFRPQIIALLKNLVVSGTPAMQARGRRLLKSLEA